MSYAKAKKPFTTLAAVAAVAGFVVFGVIFFCLSLLRWAAHVGGHALAVFR